MGSSSSREIPKGEMPKYIEHDSNCSSIVFQGHRLSMEDFIDFKKCDNETWLAVYDGHGGDSCSTFLKDKLLFNLSSSSTEGLYEGLPDVLFVHTFIKTEREFKTHLRDVKESEPKIEDEKKDLFIRTPIKHSGSCAIVAHVSKDKLIIANTGDCSSLLILKDKTYEITSTMHRPRDHRPRDEDEETKRIYKAGLSVLEQRVNGELAVSRSFGDFEYKGPSQDEFEHAVTCVPSIYQRNLQKNEKYLVLYSDGLESLNVINIVDIMLTEESLEKKLNTLVDLSYKDTRDNVSIIVYKFE